MRWRKQESGVDEGKRFEGQSLVSNAQLQDPFLLTGARDLHNYVDVVPGGLCWKDTEDGSRGA